MKHFVLPWNLAVPVVSPSILESRFATGEQVLPSVLILPWGLDDDRASRVLQGTTPGFTVHTSLLQHS